MEARLSVLTPSATVERKGISQTSLLALIIGVIIAVLVLPPAIILVVRSVAITTAPNPAIMADNPLNKIPILALDDGSVLHDSRVICEYLDALGSGGLFPPGPGRWPALRLQALADGLLDLAVTWRGERNRPAGRRSPPHLDAYRAKALATLDRLEREAPGFADAADIGAIALACALAYLDFRFADLDWRDGRAVLAAWFARFAERPSMIATAVIDDEAAA